MATLNFLRETHNSFDWYVNELGSAFNTNSYIKMVLSSGATTNGSSVPPSGILDSVNALNPTNYTQTRTPTRTYSGAGVSAGNSYLLYAYAQTSDGKYWSSGLGTVTLKNKQTDVPGNLNVVPTSSTELKVSWDSVQNATEYELRITSPAFPSRIVYSSPYYWGGLSPDTLYEIQIRAYNSSNDSWSIWSGYKYARTDKGRPLNWSWDTNKVSGSSFKLLSSEWNRFTSRVDDFRVYKGLSEFLFTPVYTGENFRASHFNDARNAIANMNPGLPAPFFVNSGEDLRADVLNHLKDSLNSIT